MSIGIWPDELHPRRAGPRSAPNSSAAGITPSGWVLAEQRHRDAVEAVADAEAGRVW